MNIHTLERLEKLQQINNQINNPRGSHLNKEGQEIAKLIESNIEYCTRELWKDVTIREMALALRDTMEHEPKPKRQLLDSEENTRDDYQRVILGNNNGEVIELCNLNYSRSKRAEKKKEDKPQGRTFWA